jgi:hypothetical protein
MKQRLDDLKVCLADILEGSIDTLYGGSVAKHTYVDGISDVDALLILNETQLAGATPKTCIDVISKQLKEKYKDAVLIQPGQMAITISYGDLMEIDCLPALKTATGLKIADETSGGWSNINPAAFQEALTRRNEQCGSKLVPMIKLAKAVNATLPVDMQVTGYHLESMAIAAFRSYDGEQTTARMLPYFFQRAADLVKRPVVDSTGQSVHVDEYLGAENSQKRLNISHVLSRVAIRMRNATAGQSIEQWRALLGEK